MQASVLLEGPLYVPRVCRFIAADVERARAWVNRAKLACDGCPPPLIDEFHALINATRGLSVHVASDPTLARLELDHRGKGTEAKGMDRESRTRRGCCQSGRRRR